MPLMPIKKRGRIGVKRKSYKEIRLQEYVNGFYACLNIFEDAFRDEVWAAQQSGKYSNMDEVAKDPRVDVIWSRIAKAQDKIRAKDNEYCDLRMSRM